MNAGGAMAVGMGTGKVLGAYLRWAVLCLRNASNPSVFAHLCTIEVCTVECRYVCTVRCHVSVGVSTLWVSLQEVPWTRIF